MFSSTSAKTEIELDLNKPILVGGGQSRTGKNQPDGTTVWTKSEKRIEVRVTEYRPDETTPEDEELVDKERLRGIWEGIELTRNGKPVDPIVVKPIQFSFEGDRLIVRGLEAGLGKRRYRFQLDASTSPKGIRLTPLQGRFENQAIPAIYDLSTGDLQICIPDGTAKESPKDFKSTVGSERESFRLTRLGRSR